MMNFEQVFDQEKKELTEALVLFGEGKRVNKVLVDLEKNRPEYYKFYDKGYEAGQQSRQKEIDELNLTIKRLITSEEDIARSCKHWRDLHRELDERIAKVLTILEEEVIEVDYDEYRFVGNFIDADKVKEILK